MEQELLDLVGEMDKYVRMASRLYPRFRLRTTSLSEVDALGRWLVDFDTELREWATIRNAVMHVPQRLSDESCAQRCRAWTPLGRGREALSAGGSAGGATTT